MHCFKIIAASSPWFFIGYWILQRGWVSTRPLFLTLVHALSIVITGKKGGIETLNHFDINFFECSYSLNKAFYIFHAT